MLSAKLMLAYLLQSVLINGISIDTTKLDPQEVYCLAENVYYEAKSEDIKGQIAVASVTLNRMRDPRFPNTICGVVQQTARSHITNKFICAFSWYCDNDRRGKEIPVRNRDGTINEKIAEQFEIASKVAITVLSGEVEDNTKGATHFHNPNNSNPSWKYELVKTITIGHHCFYRMPNKGNNI